MGAPFYNLLTKCDKALVNYIIANDAGTVADTYASKRSELKSLPCTICRSGPAMPAVGDYAPIYRVRARVLVRTQGSGDDIDNANETPETESSDRVAATWDLFNVNDDQSGQTLGQAITETAGVDDFTVISARIEEIDAGFEALGDAWSDWIWLEMVVTLNSEANTAV